MTLEQSELQQRLEFAVEAARDAGTLILEFYQRPDLVVDLKDDRSPVTAADRGAEQLLRERIGKMFPDDGVLGEEFDEKPSANEYRWILDPLDGTKSFVHGVPLFGTLMGLEFRERVMLGVCRFPALDEVVYAAEETGTWWQVGRGEPRRTQVTSVAEMSQALFCTTTVTGWDTIGRRDAFDRLCEATRMTRGWGDCFGHVLVATGRADLMIDPQLNAWDAAALVPIIQEAGGHYVDWNGETSIYTGNGCSVNAALRDQMLELLQGSGEPAK